MAQFRFQETALDGLKVVEGWQLGDDRGYLARLFCEKEFAAAGWHKPVAQMNQTFTRNRGTIRGMHFQYPPHSEMKLVRCLRGAVWDVAVDLRVGSLTFLQWHAEELSSANCRSLLIPEGFAHGFQTLSDDCELLYLHSMEYTRSEEAGLNAKDPILSIDWPMPIAKISSRDRLHPMLDRDFAGLTL
jgi:dTDP-4-dehydrorhamnose 3,5-epimerase